MVTIAISGKGGTGKTTVTAMMLRWLGDHVSKSNLAVDADSNVNLNDLLGVELRESVGEIREEMKTMVDNLPANMTKQQFLEYKVQSGLVETPDFDLLAMGRPEGPGCYCYANNLLRDILMTLSRNYDFVVIDNEAGMEHLSRRTVHDIDYLFVLSDPSVRGIRTAGKISRLLDELETRVKTRYLVLNRVRDQITDSLNKAIEGEKLDLLGTIPEDDALLEMEQSGRPIWSALTETRAYPAIDRLMTGLDIDLEVKVR
jgi:CO dehydrogenase maturation factor